MIHTKKSENSFESGLLGHYEGLYVKVGGEDTFYLTASLIYVCCIAIHMEYRPWPRLPKCWLWFLSTTQYNYHYLADRVKGNITNNMYVTVRYTSTTFESLFEIFLIRQTHPMTTKSLPHSLGSTRPVPASNCGYYISQV